MTTFASPTATKTNQPLQLFTVSFFPFFLPAFVEFAISPCGEYNDILYY